ncbi:MFS transporter [Kocuria marina]|uniref:MFS transporter n=1 Tax=Kocuria marina TaxID=223184 RepID=UPI0022E732CB|nr:MFS transporter [Kocuria marina]
MTIRNHPAPSDPHSSPPGQGDKSNGITPMQRRVLFGSSIGQFIEFYDLALYGLSAVVLSQLFFPTKDPAVGLLALFATYGAAFFIRPLGGLFFGALGDRMGRRNVLVITLLTIGVSTTGIGLLPGYSSMGVWAPVLLVLLRLTQGFSAGGESVGAPSFVFEHAPRSRRGFFINITLSATALPSVVAAFLLLGLSAAMPNESFLAWGWRVPFLLALPLALFGLWIRARTEESPVFEDMMAEKAARAERSTPVRDAFRTNMFKMIQVVFIMGLTAMGFYYLTGYFVAYMQTVGGFTRSNALLLNGISMLVFTVLLAFFGAVSDRVGRRPMMIAGTVALTVVALPSMLLVTSGHVGLALTGQLMFVLALTIYGGGCYTFFVEIFDSETRFTSAAFSYNLGYAVFGGTAPIIGTALVDATGLAHAPGFYVIFLALIVLVFIFAARVPETRQRTE